MSGTVGKRYDATKDYLEWAGMDAKRWVPVVMRMGQVWASTIARTKREK
ncbi:hypothetical protein [Hydrogenimonas urashimensis]|nr:hypothetical protein [Hydrogenimonas urashimensis]